jgi:hypothetical protein
LSSSPCKKKKKGLNFVAGKVETVVIGKKGDKRAWQFKIAIYSKIYPIIASILLMVCKTTGSRQQGMFESGMHSHLILFRNTLMVCKTIGSSRAWQKHSSINVRSESHALIFKGYTHML